MSEQLPPDGFSGKNLRDIPALIEIEEYSVAEWVRGDDGEGVPEAVCINFNLGGPLDGATFMIRLKSRKAVQTLIKALERRRDGLAAPMTGVCSQCLGPYNLRKDGTIGPHKSGGQPCRGAGLPPRPAPRA